MQSNKVVIVHDSAGNEVSVKPASTAAVGADQALVVAVSPNNTVAVTGTVTNASVGSTGSAPPASATLAGGSVTTAAPSYTTGQMSALSLNTSGGLRTDGSGVTQPISAASLPLPTGAATSANQTTLGSQTTKLNDGTNTATVTGANALKVDGSAVTQPISAASLPLPTGAATEASLAAQSLVDNAAFTDGTSRVVPGGYVFDEVAGTALTENDIAASRVDSKRAQVLVIEDLTTRGQRLTITAANAAKVDGSAVTQPISAASLPLPTGAATESSLAAQSMVDNAAFTDGTSRIVPAGYIFDEVVGTALTENDGAAARVDSKRAQVLVLEDATTRGQRQAVSAAGAASANLTQVGGNTVVTGGTNGSQGVGGLAATGAAVAGNPVLVGGSDGTNARSLATDTSGRQRVIGTAATGAAVAGDPVRVAGSDGTNTRDISTDTSGRPVVVGAAADGAAVAGNPVLVAGQDGTNAQSLLTDTSGRPRVVGTAATGVAVAGDPVRIGGSDGTLTRDILTDTSGRIVISPSGSSTTKGFANGQMVLASTTITAVRETTYTEQTSNAQRSIVSASASDASAGTGARTVKITYYSVSGSTVTGPFTETLTLNGTTPVNTVSTTIAYIEKMDVLTVGSGGVNAGIISLKATTAGGGATVWTIAVGSNKTFGAHHYVPNGKTCYISGLLVGIKGADTTGGFIRSADPTSANNAEIQISDTVRAPSSGQSFRSYATPISVVGPARIVGYATPDSSSSRTYYLSFDLYEE